MKICEKKDTLAEAAVSEISNMMPFGFGCIEIVSLTLTLSFIPPIARN